VRIEIHIHRTTRRLSRPLPISSFKYKVDKVMKTVNAIITWPTQRKDGSALAITDIDHCDVQMAIVPDDGSAPTFTSVGKIQAPDTAFQQTDLVDGDYFFRFLVWDKQKKPKCSDPHDEPVTIEFDPPAAVTAVAITVA